MSTESFGRDQQQSRRPESQEQQGRSAGNSSVDYLPANQQTIAQTAHALLKRWEESRAKSQVDETALDVPIVPAQSGESLVYAHAQDHPASSRSYEDALTETDLDFSAALAEELAAETEVMETLPRQTLQSPATAQTTSVSRKFTASELADLASEISAAVRIKNQPQKNETESASRRATQPQLQPALSAKPVVKSSPAQTQIPPAPPAFQQASSTKDSSVTSFRMSAPKESTPAEALRNALDAAEAVIPKKAVTKAVRPEFSDDYKTISEKMENRSTAVELMEQMELNKALEQPVSSPVNPFKTETKSESEAELPRLSSQGKVQFANSARKLAEFENQQVFQSPITPKAAGKQRNWSVLIGQFLAFGGALAMTGGAAIIIGNRFGSLEIAETTGWLAVAGGHMLFVLGLYTHLTSRVEQTWHDLHLRSDEIYRLLEQQGQQAYRSEFNQTQRTTESVSGKKNS